MFNQFINSHKKIFNLFLASFKDDDKFKKILIILIYCFFFAVGFSTTAFSGRVSWNIVNIALSVLLAAMCIFFCFKYSHFSFSDFFLFLILFNSSTILSWALNGFGTFRPSSITMGLVSSAFYLFLKNDSLTRNASLFFFCLGLDAFLLFFLFKYWPSVIHPQLLNNASRIGSFFGNENDVARFLAFTFFINIYLCFSYRFFSLGLFALLSFYFILLTGSVSNFLSVSIVFCLVFIFFLKGKKRLFFGASIVFVVAVLVLLINLPSFSYYKERFLGMFSSIFSGFSSSSSDPSTDNRFSVAIEAFHLALERPLFGFGFDGVMAHSAWGAFAHNNIAEVVADFGFFGLFLEELLILYPLIFCFKNRDKLGQFSLFVFLSICYIFFFQVFLVSFYSKMELIVLAFAYSFLPETLTFPIFGFERISNKEETEP